MKTITSFENAFIKHVFRLGQSNEYRMSEGLAVLEGIHLVATALHEKPKALTHLVCTDEAMLLNEVMDLLEKFEGEVIVIPSQLFKKISTVNTPVGIIGLLQIPFFDWTHYTQGFFLFLDRIQDPGNMGTLLRSAAASGFEAVFLSPGCAHLWSPKGIRAGMGAHLKLNLFENVNLIEVLKKFSQPIRLACCSKTSKNYQHVDLSQSFSLVIGNEGAGVSEELMDAYPSHLCIPMANNIESLNAGVAGSIIMFDSWRQRNPV